MPTNPMNDLPSPRKAESEEERSAGVLSKTKGSFTDPKRPARTLPKWAQRPHLKEFTVHELLGAEGVTGSGQHKGKFALTPFVAFDTGQIILRGSMDMEVVREALSEEGLFPIAGPNGNAIGSIVINNLRDSVVSNGYDEIMFCVDCSEKDGVTAVGFESGNIWGNMYAFFNTTPGVSNFLHTLYVTDTFALDASRQTQAFPKHPVIPAFTVDDNSTSYDFNINVEGNLLVEASVRKQWPLCCGLVGGPGCCMLNRMTLGFLCAFGPCRLLKLLCSANIEQNMAMPLHAVERTQDYASGGSTRYYDGVVHKGLNPLGLQVFPFSEDSTFALGDHDLVGDADNEGHTMFHKAGFTPQIVAYAPKTAFSFSCKAPTPEMDRGSVEMDFTSES